jgi:hypothetical protein
MSQPLQFIIGSILAVYAACVAAQLYVCLTGRNPFE